MRRRKSEITAEQAKDNDWRTVKQKKCDRITGSPSILTLVVLQAFLCSAHTRTHTHRLSSAQTNWGISDYQFRLCLTWCALYTMEDLVTDERWRHQHVCPAAAAPQLRRLSSLVLQGCVWSSFLLITSWHGAHQPMDNRERQPDFNVHGCSRKLLVLRHWGETERSCF